MFSSLEKLNIIDEEECLNNDLKFFRKLINLIINPFAAII